MKGPDKTTFLLGIGCQKAGTSWLHSVLSEHPRIRLPEPKELHVLDAMLRPDMFHEFRQDSLARHAGRGLRNKIAERLGRRPPRHVMTPAMHLEMIADPNLYVEFFRAQAEDADVVGEITPSYAALSRDDFAYVRDLLEPHFDVKLVLLLRDPIQRAFSAVRHFRRLNKDRYPIALRGDDNSLFERLYKTPYIWERADYRRTIENIEAVFDPGQIHIEFYEALFSQESMEKICEFIKVPPIKADADRIVNSSPRPKDLHPDLARQARKEYAPVYDYCAERFGRQRVSSLWPALHEV